MRVLTIRLAQGTDMRLGQQYMLGGAGSSREARHLIRTLRQRVEKAGAARINEANQPEIENGLTAGGIRQAGPEEALSKNYAESA